MSGGCRGEISIYDDAESRRSGTKGAMKEQSIWASRGPDITVNENAEVTAGDVVDVEGDGSCAGSREATGLGRANLPVDLQLTTVDCRRPHCPQISPKHLHSPPAP